MTTVSDFYRDGVYAETYGMYAKAAQCYQQGHEQGDAACTAKLALCYDEGAGVERNYNEYYRLAQKLEQDGNPLAHCLLASAYSDGLGCKVDIEKAKAHLEEWAKISAMPIEELAEECRLFFRGNGLRDSLEQYMELEQIDNGVKPCIDTMQATREYAEKSTLADRIMSEIVVLADDKSREQELCQRLEQACAEGIPDAAPMLSCHLLRTCADDDEDTRNRAMELMRRAGETSPFQLLLIRMELEEDTEVRQKLFEQVLNSLRYGHSGIPRADELPLRIAATRNRISAAYYIRTVDEAQALIDQQRLGGLMHTFTLPIIHITNTSSTSLEKIHLRIVQEGMCGETSIDANEEMKPGEAYSIDLNEYAVNNGNNIRMELSVADGRYTTFTLPRAFIEATETQVPQVQLYHSPDNLIILPINQDLERVVLLAPSGEKIAELSNLRKDEPVMVDIWHLKSVMLKERTESFIMLCTNADPAICFLK